MAEFNEGSETEAERIRQRVRLREAYHRPVRPEVVEAVKKLEEMTGQERQRQLERIEALRLRYRQRSLPFVAVEALTATSTATEECWSGSEIGALINDEEIMLPAFDYLERIAHLAWCSQCMSVVSLNLPVGLRAVFEEAQDKH